MSDIINDYLDKFEQNLRVSLLRLATQRGALEGKLLETPDIEDYWNKIQAEYVADAVPQIASYPTVSVAWAAYLGMAVAQCWDADWDSFKDTPYKQWYGSEGFDNMDDHIVQDILMMPLATEDAQKLIKLIQSLAQETVSAIRHEQIEPQSPMAYYAFVRACRVMFIIGEAIHLHSMGYKFEKIEG